MSEYTYKITKVRSDTSRLPEVSVQILHGDKPVSTQYFTVEPFDVPLGENQAARPCTPDEFIEKIKFSAWASAERRGVVPGFAAGVLTLCDD